MPLISTLSHRTLPIELLHRIIVQVVANSIHTICVFSGDVKWEMNALPTLCKVSYTFRAVTLKIMNRAFQSNPKLQNLSSIFPPVTKQLERLRSFGIRHHRKTDQTSYFEPKQEDAFLIYGYSLFLAAMDLRYSSIDAHPDAYQTTQELIIFALSTSLLICPKVEPVGLADVLSGAMRKQLDLVRSGLDVVRCAQALDSLMNVQLELGSSKDEDKGLQITDNLTKIHKEVEKLEEAYDVYANIIEMDDLFRTSELPGVLTVIKKLREVEVDGARHFAPGLESFMVRWTATSSFPKEKVL